MPLCEENSVEDIEDIIGDVFSQAERLAAKADVVPRVRKRKTEIKEDEEPPEEIQADSIIPGTQKIYLKTWGCSHNSSDGEYMAGQLAAYGYTMTDNDKEADLWLLNSCTVKNPAEDHFRNSMNAARQAGKYLVVAGCVPQAQPRMGYLKGVSVVGVQQIDRVLEVVEETLKGNTVRLLGQKKKEGRKTGGASLDLPKIRRNPLIEILAINTGCLNQCTYCKTKHARGELGSYPPEDLVERVKQSFQEGVCEIWLTSEDTGAYGKDIGVTIVELLKQLVEVIPEGCMLRIGMTNPPYILEHLEEIAKILMHPRVYSFLHVPVQSGSDSVLMDMKREYCVEDFRHIMDFLREKVPNVNIATDFICGFPTETEQDHAETLALVEDYKFASVFINQFFPRPGTPAARMPQVPAQEKKKRTKELSILFRSYLPYEHKLGERCHVLVTEDSTDGQYYVGHNKCYDQVLVPKEDVLLGKMVEVEIIETGKHFLKARLLQDGDMYTPSIAEPLAKGQVSGATVIQDTSEHSLTKTNTWMTMAVCGIIIAAVFRLIFIAMQYR